MSEQTSVLFNTSQSVRAPLAGALYRVALDEVELAPNHRKAIDPDAISRLARMLMTTGQLTPCIGRRVHDDRVVLYAGQRRLLAARASHELAGTQEFEGLAPVAGLIVLLLDHESGEEEIRRIQAQENQREDLALADQQAQFADCWRARAGLRDADRMAVVCADLGISPGKGHSLLRQLALPDSIRVRIAERPGEDQLSVRMAHRLADLHDVAPELTEAVAARVTTGQLHDRALRDLGGFVHRTVVEDERVYAVRIDDGALLDAGEQIRRARGGSRRPSGARRRAFSAVSPTSSTPSSTRSPPAPRPMRSSCESTGTCATAPPTAAMRGSSTAAATSPPASG